MTNIKRLKACDTGFEVEYEWSTYRFLLFDGSVVDVRAVSDDSWLRDAVVKMLKLDEKRPIVGVATLPEPMKPVKRAGMAKKAAPK